MNLGFVPVGSMVDFKFTSHAASGAPVAPSTAFESADLQIYKDNSATPRSSALGITMTSPFNAVVGLHHVRIDLSDNTDAGFYAAGSVYEVVLKPDETVDSLAVTEIVARFTIGVQVANVTQWLGTAAATPTVAGVPEVDLTHIAGSAVSTSSAQLGVNVVNAAGTAWGSGAITAGVIAADAIGASELAADAVAEIADAVWDEDATLHQTLGTFGQAIGDPVADTNTIYKAVVTDATAATVGLDVVDALGRIGTPSNLGGGATVAANLSDIEAQTDDIGIAGAGLTAIGPVTLANGAHGGSAAVLTLERVIVASTTIDEPAVNLTGNGVGPGLRANGGTASAGIDALGAGTGAGLRAVGGATDGSGVLGVGQGIGSGISGVGGSFDGPGIGGYGTGNGHGFRMVRGTGGGGDDLSFANNDVTIPLVTTTSTVTALGTQAKADVNAEVLDVLNVDTFAQPGQEAPAATTSLSLMLRYLYKFLRNRVTSTATTISVYADDATTVDQKSTHSDNTTTYDRGEFVSGP